MFNIVDGRKLSIGDKVEVYYNLHKGGFSILSREKEFKGKVVAYASNIQLKDAEFRVSDATLRRILSTKRKSVYASVRGILIGVDEQNIVNMEKVYINPYTCPYFTNSNNERVFKSNYAYFEKKICYIQ